MSAPHRTQPAGRVTGTVIEVARKSGPVLYIKARDRSGHQHKPRLGPVADWPGGKNGKAAQDELRRYLVDLGREPDGPADHVRLDDAISAFITYVEHERDRSAGTVSDYRNVLNHRVIDFFGTATPIDRITTEDIDALRRHLLAQISRRTAQKTLVVLHGLLSFAKRRRWVAFNAAADAEKVQVRRRVEFAVMDPAQVFAVARATRDELLGSVVVVAAFTGLRMNELRALRWRDVDFGGRIVHVRRNLPRNRPGDPKSHQARSVPLMDDAARALNDQSRRGHHVGPDDPVFAHELGRISDARMRNGLYAAMAAAGIDRDMGTGKKFVFHDLRHTYGTLAVRIYPLSDVRAYMGHADVGTTMLYVHHTPQHEAADKMTALVREALGTSGYPNDLIERV